MIWLQIYFFWNWLQIWVFQFATHLLIHPPCRTKSHWCGSSFSEFLVVCFNHETICSSRIRPKNPTGRLHVAPTCFTYRKRLLVDGRCSSKIARAIPGFKSALHRVQKNWGIFAKDAKNKKDSNHEKNPIYLCLLAFLNERCSPEVT